MSPPNQISMDEILDLLAKHNPNAVLIDGYDAALIGAAWRGSEDPVACYSLLGLHRVALANPGADQLSASEYVDLNILGASFGPNGPIFLAHPPELTRN